MNLNCVIPQDLSITASPEFIGLTLSSPSSAAAVGGLYITAGGVVTTTPSTSGVLGFWDRTGTVLSPVETDDDITLPTGSLTITDGIITATSTLPSTILGSNETGNGVLGASVSGAGMSGTSISGVGVFGASTDSYSGFFNNGLGVYCNKNITVNADSGTGDLILGAAQDASIGWDASGFLDVQSADTRFSGSLRTDDIIPPSGTLTVSGGLRTISAVYPVIDIVRETSLSSGLFAGARMKRTVTSGGGVGSDGNGIGFFFEVPDSIGASTFGGMFGGALETVANGSEIGQLIFAPAYHNVDPFARTDMTLTALGAATSKLTVKGRANIGRFDDDLSQETLRVETDINTMAVAHFHTIATATNDYVGIGFGVMAFNGQRKQVKSAIAHQRKGSYGQGEMVFCVDPDATGSDVSMSDEVMRLTKDGLGITGTLGVSGITTLDDVTYIGDKSGGTDYTEFEADGTMVAHGNATVWDDQQVNLHAVRFHPTQSPTWTDYHGSQVIAFSDTTDNTIYFNAQLSHKYEQEGDIEFHVHYAIETDGAGGGIENVAWSFTYAWSNIDGAIPVETTVPISIDVQSKVDDTHYLGELVATITGTGKNMSSILLCSLKRDVSEDSYGSDVYLLDADFHIPLNTMGSRAEGSK